MLMPIKAKFIITARFEINLIVRIFLTDILLAQKKWKITVTNAEHLPYTSANTSISYFFRKKHEIV